MEPLTLARNTLHLVRALLNEVGASIRAHFPSYHRPAAPSFKLLAIQRRKDIYALRTQVRRLKLRIEILSEYVNDLAGG